VKRNFKIVVRFESKELLALDGGQAKGVILVDLAWILHRGYHAIPVSTIIDGKTVKTGHYFSLVKLIAQAKKNFPWYSFILCLDSFPEEKHNEFKSYKTGRVHHFPLKETMINASRMVCSITGVYAAISKGKEADEVMHSLSRDFDIPVMIMSGDNDLLQSVKNGVILVRSLVVPLTPISQKYVDKKWGMGVPLEKILIYRALIGDTSDKIDGVMSGKRAKKILKEVNNEDEVYEWLHDLEKQKYARNIMLMKLNRIDVTLWKSILVNARELGRKYNMYSLLYMLKYERE